MDQPETRMTDMAAGNVPELKANMEDQRFRYFNATYVSIILYMYRSKKVEDGITFRKRSLTVIKTMLLTLYVMNFFFFLSIKSYCLLVSFKKFFHTLNF